MAQLFQNYRRRHMLTHPFPEMWEAILVRTAPFRQHLDAAFREKLDRGIMYFVNSRVWEGCGGLCIEDEHRVTIAAHAMRLTLGFEDDYFDDVETVLVYPSPYEAPHRQPIGSGLVLEGHSSRRGESWYHGPVILAWSDIVPTIHQDCGPHNLILHEFAHQLDYRNGSEADGVPPIESAEQADEWISVMDAAYDRLLKQCKRGQATSIDQYATTNMAEFFAVTTELFFESPHLLSIQWPEVFRVLKRFYKQDPGT